jgi:hypothetical protein
MKRETLEKRHRGEDRNTKREAAYIGKVGGQTFSNFFYYQKSICGKEWLS